jgi:anti-anti-sigma regulatory factor
MGIQQISTPTKGKTVLSLSGEYSISDAGELKQDMVKALDKAKSVLHLDVAGVEQVDMLFFQLLFALASQASLDGKNVVLNLPLPEPLRLAAEGLGLDQHDFEQTFTSGVS